MSVKVAKSFKSTGDYTVGFISLDGLGNLKHYEYQAGYSSWLDVHIMDPFWCYVASWLPRWLAPNAITMLAFCHALVAQLLLQYSVPNLTEEAPRWIYLVCALCIFNYQTLDGIDGKQARQTGASSPLGELLDHGCDAVCCFLTGLMLAAMLQTGSSPSRTYLLLLINIVPFFMCNWEACCLGFMRFGVIGVSEGQLTIIVLFLTTALFGPSVWTIELCCGLVIRDSIIGIAACGSVYQAFSSFIWVLQNRNKMNVFNRCWSQLIQYLIFLFLSTVWLICMSNDPTSPLYVCPRLVFSSIGIAFAYQVNCMIVYHVTQEHYPTHTTIGYGLILLIATQMLAGQTFHFMLCYAFLTYNCIMYLAFALLCIRQITRYLGISFLFIDRV